MYRLCHRWLRDETGATAAEYALIITAIAGVIIALVFLIGDQLAAFFERAAAAFL